MCCVCVYKTTENRSEVATGWELRGAEGIDYEDERTFGGNENTLCLSCGVCITVYISSAHRTIYLKGVDFTVCKLYLNKPVFSKKTTLQQLCKECVPLFPF